MEEILVAILQFVFELALDILANLPFDWPSRGRSTPEPENVAPRAMAWFGIGSLLGWASTWLVGHTFISIAPLRMLNVVLAPVLSAFLSQAIARRRAASNANIIPRNHFWQAFWFTLGLVLVRFAYAVRG